MISGVTFQANPPSQGQILACKRFKVGYLPSRGRIPDTSNLRKIHFVQLKGLWRWSAWVIVKLIPPKKDLSYLPVVNAMLWFLKNWKMLTFIALKLLYLCKAVSLYNWNSNESDIWFVAHIAEKN